MKKKILVMRYRFIGDTLLTVPFLRNLRYAYPDAQIDMLIAPKSGERGIVLAISNANSGVSLVIV